MIKLKDLLSMTPKEVIDRARSVTIYYVIGKLALETPNQVSKYIELKAKDMATKGPTKDIVIKLYGLHKDGLNDNAWVTCSCEHFLYNLEVANTSHGSSSILHSNGNAPAEKNPNLMPGLCKHLAAAAMRINNFEIKDLDNLSILI